MSTTAVAVPLVFDKTDPADQGPEVFTAYLAISPKQLARFIKAGSVPRPDIVLSKKCLRWRRSTVSRWRAGIEGKEVPNAE